MPRIRLNVKPHPVTREVRWRHRFTIVTVLTTVLLLAWGAFVTSINAGLAVPDWPTSFNSYDPFNPWPEWWRITPVLAEHGHRLLGALVGIFTVILAVWTWRADPRRWMRRLGWALLVLVIAQGILGGLRVNLVSLDLAVVHACVAQIFFSSVVAMALFTSPTWLRASFDAIDGERVHQWGIVTVLLLYLQVVLGALLRHPGTGIDPLLVTLHIVGATLVLVAIIFSVRETETLRHRTPLLFQAGRLVGGLVLVQIALGFTAYFVTLDESGVLEPSNLQVIVNSTHMVVGALLLAASVGLTLLAVREHRAAPHTVAQPA